MNDICPQTKIYLENFKKIFDFSIVPKLQITNPGESESPESGLDLKRLVSRLICDNDLSSQGNSGQKNHVIDADDPSLLDLD